MEARYIPEYNKPDEPGIAMNFDNTVSIYLVVGPEDTFADSARSAFRLIKEAQERFPGWLRSFYLDIVGHEGSHNGFEEDFLEFQQELFFSTMARFLTAFELPLTGALVNPNEQINDLPDELIIAPPRT